MTNKQIKASIARLIKVLEKESMSNSYDKKPFCGMVYDDNSAYVFNPYTTIKVDKGIYRAFIQSDESAYLIPLERLEKSKTIMANGTISDAMYNTLSNVYKKNYDKISDSGIDTEAIRKINAKMTARYIVNSSHVIAISNDIFERAQAVIESLNCDTTIGTSDNISGVFLGDNFFTVMRLPIRIDGGDSIANALFNYYNAKERTC